MADILSKNKLNVLIIDSNFFDNSIYKIFNKKIENKIIKINNFYLSNKYIKKEINKFNIIIFDNPNIYFLEKNKLINNSINIFISESNLLGIKKINNLINKNIKKINIKNINIIFNKYNSNSIDYEILNKVYKRIKILGIIKYDKKIEKILNTGKLIKINLIKKELNKIIKKLKIIN